MPHTAEPWEFKGRSLYEKDAKSNEIAFFGDEPEDVLNGERAAKCVNALAGLSDYALDGGWNYKEISAYAKRLEHVLADAKAAYVELTNSVSFADNGEAAYVADQRLMTKFDDAFDQA